MEQLRTSLTVPTVNDEQRAWMDWGNYHRNLFGWMSENEIRMVNSWIGFFRRGGFTPPEMIAASECIAKQTEKVYKREDHLQLLQVHLTNTRQRNYLRKQTNVEDNRGICVHCSDSGAVSVPLLRDVVDNQWTSRKTCAVWCTCWNGRQYHNTRNAKNEQMMGLPEYRSKNPLYQQQLRDALALDKEKDFLITEAQEVSGSRTFFDQCRERLMRTWGMIA